MLFNFILELYRRALFLMNMNILLLLLFRVSDSSWNRNSHQEHVCRPLQLERKLKYEPCRLGRPCMQT